MGFDLQLNARARSEAEVLVEKFTHLAEGDILSIGGTDAGALNVDYVRTCVLPIMKKAPLVLVIKGGAVSADQTTTDVKDALSKALETLCYPREGIEFLRIGEEAAETLEVRQALTKRAIEVGDPEVVIAIDEAGWELLGVGDSDSSSDSSRKMPASPQRFDIRGRTYLSVGNFEEALVDEKKKQRSWALLKTIKRVNQIY